MPKAINPRKSPVFDKHPLLKGKQSRLPDELQGKIIGSKLRKTAGVSNFDKLAFKYKRDVLGALGGGLLGGGLGYASGTDGKNNTPNNRMKRALIGAGIGGGVGLGFGRMSRKLEGAQGELNKAKALNDERLSQMRGLKDQHGLELSALRNQHIDERSRRVIDNNKRFADQGTRYMGELDAMRGQRDAVQTQFDDLTRQVNRQKRETPRVSPVPDVQQAAPAAAKPGTGVRQRLGESMQQRETEELRKQLRDYGNTRGHIPDHVLEGMSAEDLKKALKKRKTRSAEQSAFQRTLDTRKDQRKQAVENLQSISDVNKRRERFADVTETMTPDEISAFAKKHNLEGADSRSLRKSDDVRVQEILDSPDGERYYDNLRLQRHGNKEERARKMGESRKRTLDKYREQMKTSSFAPQLLGKFASARNVYALQVEHGDRPIHRVEPSAATRMAAFQLRKHVQRKVERSLR